MTNTFHKDVTHLVDFQTNDDECLPITRCVCGKEFKARHFIISIYNDEPHACEYCGAKLFFSNSIRVFQVIDIPPVEPTVTGSLVVSVPYFYWDYTKPCSTPIIEEPDENNL